MSDIALSMIAKRLMPVTGLRRELGCCEALPTMHVHQVGWRAIQQAQEGSP